jgi:uncharacterized protein YutE (UPF0331/DUF86 family)
MRLDLYQAETARIAHEQGGLLEGARATLQAGGALSALELNGVLHAIQVLAENAIGKAKRLLKAGNEPVPVSAHDAFSSLARRGGLSAAELLEWQRIVGLRNRIVHDYMNIDMERILELVRDGGYHRLTEFLLAPADPGNTH